MKNTKDMTAAEKLQRIGKAKYGQKFIRVVFPDNQPFAVLEHRGHLNRRMADAYGLFDESIDREYEEYFGKYVTVNEVMRLMKKALRRVSAAPGGRFRG